MVRPTPLVGAFLAAVFLCVATCLHAADAAPLRVRADVWMPYNGDPKAEKVGYVVELLQEVFVAAQTPVDYDNQGWSEALEAVRKGSIDAVIGANRKEAEGLVLNDESVGEPRMGLFVRKDIRWMYNNLQSLDEIKLAAIEGYAYWESLDDYLARNPKKIHWLRGETPLADGLQLLDTGKVDVIAETLPVFVWAVKRSGRNVSDYRVAFKQEGEEIFVAFAANERGRALAATWDAGLKALRASGRLDQILKGYGLTDWKK